MPLIRPRLNDYYNSPFTQEEVDFAIPLLDEDIPLFVDPFLLWKSPSYQDNALHTSLINSFNHLGYLANRKKEEDAIEILIRASECDEVGLGLSIKRKGLRFGKNTAESIIALYKEIPQITKSGFRHFEEIQLYVDQVSKDRISDIACSFLKSFLIDYTINQSLRHKIPLQKTVVKDVYDYKTNRFVEKENVHLPINPQDGSPVLLVPKRWLRVNPWISYEDYHFEHYSKRIDNGKDLLRNRIEILDFNRHNYDLVKSYVEYKERTQGDCKNDPLFRPIPIFSAKRKLSAIVKLPTGKTGGADKKYEDYIYRLMASLLYPHLDFACDQVRTESGVQIRDLIFYNNRSMDFLKDIYDYYDCRQMVMELKNVKEVENEHINQLNRYLKEQLGRFGIIITRNELPKRVFKNTIDLWSGQRRCIICLTDGDLKLMTTVFESKQRLPIEVIKKRYIEFARACPG